MTALTIPAQPEQDESLPPVPWSRMAWVTWRRHRLTLAGVALLLGAAALYLWTTGLTLHHAYAAVTACRPAGSGFCQQAANNFNSTYSFGAGAAAALLQAVPALIGAFAGAPVLARELETGTFRYAWTQGIGRTRWTVAMLAPLAIAVTAAAGALGLLFAWSYQPIFGPTGYTPFYATMFDLRWVTLAAWTLAAFAIGALAGMLIRRVIPAMTATLAVWAGLAFATGGYLRQRYLSPLTTSNPNMTAPAWVISQWWTQDGKPTSTAAINQTLQAIGVKETSPGLFQTVGLSHGQSNPVQYLTQHGFVQWSSYQPASRLWPFQWIEGGWLLALSALLITATIWLVRRRAA
jgi:hypothetical protein